MTGRSNQPDRHDADDAFALQMRQKAEEAAAASIHHASLSQQYLALSQKYSVLAEQSLQDAQIPLVQAAAALDRESDTGLPAPPMQWVTGQSSLRSAAPRSTESLPPQDNHESAEDIDGTLKSSAKVADPPSETAAASHSETATPEQSKSSGQLSPQRGLPQPVQPRRRGTAKRRRPVRDLVRQLHRAAPAFADRVRVRARRGDLKPRLRKPVEELRNSGRPAAISGVICAVILALLGMLRLTFHIDPPLQPIVASFATEPEQVPEAMPIEPPEEEPGDQQEADVEQPVDKPEPDPMDEPEMVESESAEAEEREVATPEPAQTDPAADGTASTTGVAVNGRNAAGRAAMLQKYGGSQASESAVQQALQWLTSVQRPDGSWDFPDIGACSSPGKVNNPIGGTAYALLPFLAAGQTHQQGHYRQNVRAGLDYLMKTGVAVPAGLDLRGVLNKGNRDEEPNEAYYVHGAATLALNEAWWMTRDRRIRPAAHAAAQFLLNSQDPRGGGWRYLPQQAGSTSVTAIQVMALKAAQKGGLQIPDGTWHGAMHYLDSVQVDREGRYGYEIQKRSYQASLTAMALLSRMYMGWGRNDGDMRQGVALLHRKGPYDNLYYNYFATQVMRNWGGEEWHQWNARLRDDLVNWQEQEGPETGSWKPRDRADYSVAGGRLLTTCLAALTLEVYYRYQPLLPEPATGEAPLSEPLTVTTTAD